LDPRSLDLAHRRDRRDQRRQSTHDQGSLRVIARRARRALLEGLGEKLARRPGRHVANGLCEHVGEALLSEQRRQADHRYKGRDHREGELERERPGVAEPVREAEAHEAVAHQLPRTDRPEGLERVVALELVRFRDPGGGAHG
jgi:hypothetical protein